MKGVELSEENHRDENLGRKGCGAVLDLLIK